MTDERKKPVDEEIEEEPIPTSGSTEGPGAPTTQEEPEPPPPPPPGGGSTEGPGGQG